MKVIGYVRVGVDDHAKNGLGPGQQARRLRKHCALREHSLIDMLADEGMGADSTPELSPITWKNKPLASLANMASVRYQMGKISHGKAPRPEVSPLRALIEQQAATLWRTRQYRKWMARRSKEARLGTAAQLDFRPT